MKIQNNIAIFIDLENLGKGCQEKERATNSNAWKINNVLKAIEQRILKEGKIEEMKGYISEDYFCRIYRTINSIKIEIIPCEVRNNGKRRTLVDGRMSKDMFSTALIRRKIKTIVMVAGDGDYFPFIEGIIEKNRRVLIIFIKEITARWLFDILKSKNGIKTKSEFIDIQNLLENSIIQDNNCLEEETE